ncbi:MAG: 6-bladed beta-propeller [Gemmatimonadota bacterium]
MKSIFFTLGIAAAVFACSHDGPAPATGRAFEEVFQETGVVRLVENPRDPIIDVPQLAFAKDGRIAFADRRANRVRVFARSGESVGDVGRMGDGPGEFRSPSGVAFDSAGGLAVADSKGRITRFSAGLQLDTVFQMDGVAAGLLALPDDRLLVHMLRRAAPMLDIVSMHGKVLGSFHTIDPLVNEVPYWISASIERIAVGDTLVLAADNLVCPIHAYDTSGHTLGTFGQPPRSWRQAERLRRGEFVDQNLTRWEAWLRTFTQISGLGVLANGGIVVVHGQYAPSRRDRWAVEDYALDLYDGNGVKRLEDVPVPGRFVGVDGGTPYFMVSEPPEGWVVKGYSLRR